MDKNDKNFNIFQQIYCFIFLYQIFFIFLFILLSWYKQKCSDVTSVWFAYHSCINKTLNKLWSVYIYWNSYVLNERIYLSVYPVTHMHAYTFTLSHTRTVHTVKRKYALGNFQYVWLCTNYTTYAHCYSWNKQQYRDW